LHAPSGTDVVPYVARAHLSGPRRGEPLVVVDGTSSREHDPARWLDPLTSPLVLADRGLLLLVDGAALSPEVQRTIARACAERRAPWDIERPLDIALAMTAVTSRAELVAAGRLEAPLAARFDAAAAAELPRLRDRPEDLRAIVSDRLAREGLRVRGVPVGIDDAAFARLLDHPFEAEDAELAALAVQLVAACEGDVVRVRHVDRLFAHSGAASGAGARFGT
jgi:DNA-binding NtrC family response regulator